MRFFAARSDGSKPIPPVGSAVHPSGWRTLRTKLVAAFMAVALIPFGLSFYLGDHYTRVTLIDNANQALLAAASQTAFGVDSFVNNNLNAIGTEAQLPDFIKYLSLPPDRRKGSTEETEATSALYALSRKDQANILSYALLDHQGLTLIDTFTPDIGVPKSSHDYFQFAVDTGMAYASPVQFSEKGIASLYFSAPVRDTAAGKTIGVLYARYSASVLEQIIVQNGELAGRQSYAILLDENHVRLAHGTNPELVFKAVMSLDPARAAQLQTARRLPRKPIKELATNLPAFEQSLVNADKQPYFTTDLGETNNKPSSAAVARLTTQPWLIVFTQPQEVLLASVRTQGRAMLLLGLGVIAVVIAVVTGMTRLLTVPIGHLTSVARLVANGNLGAKAQVDSKDEVGVLADTFNLMTDRLVETLKGLRTSEERYRSLIDKVQTAVVLHDGQGNILTSNPLAQRLLGLSEDQLLGRALANPEWHFLREDNSVMPVDEYPASRVLASRQPLRNYVAGIHHPDRSHVTWSLVNADPEYDEAGQIVQVIVSFVDITERKRAEEQLRESEERLRLTLEAAQIGTWDWDVDHDQWSASPTYYTMLGYEAKTGAADRLEWMERLHPDDRALFVKKMNDTLLRNYQEYEYEARLRHADGTYRWQHIKGFGFKRDQNGRVLRMLGVRMDIHDRKVAEEKLRILNEELEHRVATRTAELQAANKELEAFAYSVSHDLRAPLRHIDGFLDLLRARTTDTLDDKSRHYMDTISDAARRMGTLIDDLLGFSRMGRKEMATESVRLGDLLQEVIHEFDTEIQGRNIDWRIGELPVVIGDRAMLHVALVNLISNSLKFTQKREQATIDIGSLPGDADEAIIFVRDNGAGFDMQYADKLFGVFQRLHASDEFEGTGIGLANVRRIISRHGGRTWAEGKVDGGATFFLALPRRSLLQK